MIVLIPWYIILSFFKRDEIDISVEVPKIVCNHLKLLFTFEGSVTTRHRITNITCG